MKKFALLCLFASGAVFAQEESKDNPMADKNNEVRLDVLSPIAFGKAVLSYERFVSEDWSVGLSGTFTFGKKFDEDFDEGYRNTSPKYEVTPYVRYRLSKTPSHYYFIEAFVSANSGDFREILRQDDGTSGYYTIAKDDYFDVALGGSLGYKIYFGQKIVLEFLVGAGYNLIDTDKSPDVVSRVGLNLGYRF